MRLEGIPAYELIMEQDISDSVHVTDSLSGTHNLYVNASGAEPVATQTASYLA